MKKRNSMTSLDGPRLSRRDFGRLTAAAFGGVLLGSTLVGRAADPEEKPAPAADDKHVCRGLNTCKGENACKGQGGCGGKAGENSCKGQGGCEVPLKEKTWKKARKAFEAKMKAAGKTVGEAPKASS